MIPLSIYIHFPWCVKKCPYCDFNSHQFQNTFPEEEYLQRLIHDLRADQQLVEGRPIQSIFLGGGTPSLFSPQSFQTLLTAIKQEFDLLSDVEITLEANPGTVEQGRFEGYVAAGINRVSLGLQSLNERHLKKLGRIHDADEAEKAVLAARNAGFLDINTDIMYGLPSQTPFEALDDLQKALSLQPTHFSWYQLTLEPGTNFYHQKPPLPQDEAIEEMMVEGLKILEQHGFKQYEVSAFYKKSLSKHNLNYWTFGDYLGIGAGSHSKITHLKTGQIQRFSKIRLPKAYLTASNLIAEERLLSKDDLILEFMMNALRLNEGFDMKIFEERTFLPFETLTALLAKAVEKNWLQQVEGKIMPTPLGFLFLNDVMGLFVP